MIKIYIVTSRHSELPLAEVRTDGVGLDFVVDNTDGRLPQMVRKSFKRLKEIVFKSSHLHLDEPTKPTAHLLRYLLDNGDLIEITTDGKTAILNGKLLQENEKNAIFNAVRSGELKVAQRTNLQSAIPILPSKKPDASKETKPVLTDKSLLDFIAQKNKERDKLRSLSSSDYDHDLEKIDLSDLDTADDEGVCRNMLYYIKYGKFKGDK